MSGISSPIPSITLDDVYAVSPALSQFTKGTIIGDLWERPGLSFRDRAIVTVSALITRSQTIGMQHYFNLALDNQVKPGELSEIVTHLAFYASWSNAFTAIPIMQEVFRQHGITADQLPSEAPQLLPLDEASEAQRAQRVGELFGKEFPGVVQYTTDALFRNLWLRPDLAPRDRSLVTVSALIAAGQVAQIPYHLNRAMEHGLTQEQASEVAAHLAFYAGWPNVFSALPVMQGVFAERTA